MSEPDPSRDQPDAESWKPPAKTDGFVIHIAVCSATTTGDETIVGIPSAIPRGASSQTTAGATGKSCGQPTFITVMSVRMLAHVDSSLPSSPPCSIHVTGCQLKTGEGICIEPTNAPAVVRVKGEGKASMAIHDLGIAVSMQT